MRYWGYNDWNADTYSIAQLGDRYYDLLINLCKEQPDATIYAILPTYTTRIEPKSRKDKSIGIDQLRDAESEAIEKVVSMGHSNVKMIDGWQLTTKDDLVDAVHLTQAGSERFAKKLAEVVTLP